jgi:hypothetical protein
MTSQTRTFIEFSDLIALHLECKKCGCSLLVSVGSEEGTLSALVDKYNGALAKCPTCSAEWIPFNQSTGAFVSEIKDFLRKMAYLRKIEEVFGCKVSFEIKTSAQ